MAMTEARPEAETPHPASLPVGDVPPALAQSPVAAFFGTGRDSVIGRLWIGTSLVFLALTGVLGGVIGAERVKPEVFNIFSNDSYGQALSLHGVSGLFLVAIPLTIGVATIVVPCQVGAATIAFPRAAALAFWGYLGGGVLVVISYLINGGPFGGNDKGVDLFLASLGLVAVSLGLALLCIAVTVVGLRVPGLYIERTPLFSWSMLVAATVWIAGLGLLVGTLTLLYIDHRYRAFNIAQNNDFLDTWLRWTMTQPQVYAAAIPVLGFAADAIATATRARPPQRHLFGTIGAFSILTFGAWTYNYFAHPDMRHEFMYMAMGVAIVVPLLLYTAGIGGMFLNGSARVISPMLFAVTALLLLWGGVLTGAVRVIHRLKLVDSTADSSVVHYVLGAAVVAAIGAVHYWWPQVLRRPLREGVARLTALLLLIGVGALASVDLVSGLLDEPRGSAYTTARDGVTILNAVSLAGGVLVLIGVVLFVINLAVSLARRADDDLDVVDPWEGQTLEWAADPAAITVESGSPLLDRREAGAAAGAGS